MSSRTNDPLISFLNQANFPFVTIGHPTEYPQLVSVDNDNVQASYDATNHLIEQGHQRIGFVSGPPELTVSKDRLKGYMKALSEAGLAMRNDWIVEGEFLQESGYRAMSYIMSLPEHPTGLVIIDDMVAFGVLHGLTELGFRVPEDVCLVSFNNISLAELSSPPISSIDIGTYQIGYTTAQMLIKIIQGQELHLSRVVIPHRLIVRQSSTKTWKETLT